MKTLKTAIIGLAFIAAGAVIILCNIGILDFVFRKILISWQMLLIVVALLAFADKNYKAGSILLIVGAFFMMPLIPHIDLGTRFVKNFWPLMLVLIGIVILWTRKNNTIETKHKLDNTSDSDSHFSNSYSIDGYLDQTFFLNGSNQVYVGNIFKGGRISTVFGGTQLDLRNTDLLENQEAILSIKGFCGGLNILVPKDWTVIIHNSSLLGGFSDLRPNNYGQDITKKLIINVEFILGGAVIK